MISGELISAMQLEFKEFLTPFNYPPFDEDPIVQKTLEHINQVVENSRILAGSLDLSDTEKAVAEMNAQFHDIGRLWLLVPGNSEIKDADHSQLSIEYLKSSEAFKKVDDQTQNIVKQVIKYHNKPELPLKENDTILFYLKLLRDADKLDVWRGTTEYIIRKSGKPNMAQELSLSEKAVVTPSFCKIIIDGGIPNKNDLVTFNDFIIFQMSWIFDLHFKKSFQIVNQKQYIRHLYDSLPKNDNVIEIYRMLRIYIENKI